MEQTVYGFRIEKQLTFTKISIDISKIGQDYLIVIQGGTTPHIGCAVIAIPRESLKVKNQISCTSSVFNLSGHKDEQLCRALAEALCKRVNATVVCTGGFHTDNITEKQLSEVNQATEELVNNILKSFPTEIEPTTTPKMGH